MKQLIPNRIKALQTKMIEEDIDIVLLRQNADLFYFTHTVQDAHLLIPAKAPPHLLVWRVYERALRESPLEQIEPLKGLSHFKEIVRELGFHEAKTIGLEMDVLPANLFLFYSQNVWPNSQFKDISTTIRQIKSIKDIHEIECIKVAANQAHEVLKRVPEMINKAETELELAALVEAELRKRGHCGLIRMRLWNQEMGMDQVISGTSATIPAWTLTPVGGEGPHPAFGQGASFKKLRKNEIISVDIGGWHGGYCCDITRPFFWGSPPVVVLEHFEKIKRILSELESLLRPGNIAGDIYERAMALADQEGISDVFMGIGNSRVPFVGHGLGIELDEFPFISKKNKMRLESGMVLALEPKIILERYGVIGLEDTYLIENDGCIRLTLDKQELTII